MYTQLKYKHINQWSTHLRVPVHLTVKTAVMLDTSVEPMAAQSVNVFTRKVISRERVIDLQG